MRYIRYDNDLQIGAKLPISRVYNDGDLTGETLSGTSVLEVGTDRDGMYPYPHKYIVDGDFLEYGEDTGEVVVANCVVVERIY